MTVGGYFNGIAKHFSKVMPTLAGLDITHYVCCWQILLQKPVADIVDP
jgi:hypothetical protein